MAQRTANALAFAHQQGILHRDLKPTNLFLQNGDIERVQILDFGIARRLAASRAMTRTGMIIGTPEYMAPEQARGARELTPAADLFSLGCILYECLAGEPPFVAEHVAAVLVRILFEEPAPIAQRRPGIPGAVSALLQRLLAKDVAERIGNASELALALAAIGELSEPSDQSDLPLQPTLAAPGRASPMQADGEQVLLSLVMALSQLAPASSGSTERSSDALAEIAQRGTLPSELKELGAQADLLLGGALVATVPQMASAQDQATLAARCAVLVKEHWPEAQVVVVTGRGVRSRGGLTGEVLDRAWRLLEQAAQSLGPSSTAQVRIDEVSAGLLESRFDLAPLPQRGAYALGSERLASDAGRLLLGKPTPCVGRERDLAMLEALYSECKEEQMARAVLVLAPPGLGKSRLRHEFLRRLEARGEQPVVLLGRGDPLKTKSAYGLLGEALRQRLELRTGQSLAEQHARLRERIGTELPAADALRVTVFLGELCGIPFPDEESPMLRAARQDHRIMSEQVEQAWLDALQFMRSEEPLCLVLEDLHWSDALTVRLVDATLRRLHDHALLVLALARPEVQELYPNLWAGVVHPWPLHPLPRKASERLVRQVLSSDVSPEQIERMVAQSAGNPLYLEELLRAAAEHKPSELPETVAAMIQARIGRLPAGTRRTLRVASVFGETFWERGAQSLLTATHGEEAEQGSLAELVREEIVEKTTERRMAHETQYRFRHALLRDAAYGLLSAEERVAWHAAAGLFLERAGERDASLLAEHYRIGNQLAQAAHWYAKAAEQAHDAAAMEAALACTERGMACGAAGAARGALLSVRIAIGFWQNEFQDILRMAPEALSLLPAGGKLWCQIFVGFFPALTHLPQRELLGNFLGQFLAVDPSSDALASYVRALAYLIASMCLAGQKGFVEKIFPRLRQVATALPAQDRESWSNFYIPEAFFPLLIDNRPHSCVLVWKNCLQATCDAGKRRQQAGSGAYYGKALLNLGQIDAATSLLRRSLALAEQVQDDLPMALSWVFLAEALAVSDHGDSMTEAELLCAKAIKSRLPYVPGIAHGVLARIALRRKNLALAESEAKMALQMLRIFPPFTPDIAALAAHILSAQGKEEESLKLCRAAVQEQESLGIQSYGLVDLYVAWAEAQSRSGMLDQARNTVEQALSILRYRVVDIPDSAWRVSYLRRVPENARLLELGVQWGFDVGDLIQLDN